MSLLRYISEGCGCVHNDEYDDENELEETSLSTAVPPTNEPINLSKKDKEREYIIRKEINN